MQTKLTIQLAKTREGREAEAILRSCVHCGFCTATCPTYQLLGDERDGPRGRIYLIKQVMEGAKPTRETQLRLDRCLSCRACETTCPSGVQYGRLADIGREHIEKQVRRPLPQRWMRYLLMHTIPYPKRIGLILRAGHLFKPLLLDSLKQKLPPIADTFPAPKQHHNRKMLVLDVCVQSVASPATNKATTFVLDKLGIELISASGDGCCGALCHHLSATEMARQQMKNNIDAWWPYIEAGAEAIISTASGCGTMVKDYGVLLSDDPAYADKAKAVSSLSRDVVEIVSNEIPKQGWSDLGQQEQIAFQSPCSLQHGQQLNGQVEALLKSLGFCVLAIRDSHLCCGSAGTYSILQPALSKQLRENKLNALNQVRPERIVTANIGCQMHLSSSEQTLTHWIELVAGKLTDADE